MTAEDESERPVVVADESGDPADVPGPSSPSLAAEPAAAASSVTSNAESDTSASDDGVPTTSTPTPDTSADTSTASDSTPDAAPAGRPLLILFLVTLVDMIGIGIVIPFLTFLVRDLGANDGLTDSAIGIWVGVILASYAFAQFVMSPFWGGLSDRVGRRPILLIGLTGNTVFFVLFGLSATLWMALATRLLAGIFNANISVTRAYIGDISAPQDVAKRMGILGAAFGLGFMIGPAIGGLLSNPAEQVWGTFLAGTVLETYPYLLPCLAASALSTTSLVLALRRLPESLSPEARSTAASRHPTTELVVSLRDAGQMLLRPGFRAIMWVNVLYWVGFTMMHTTFILFTSLLIIDGGLGLSERDNGVFFTYIGLLGVIIQGRLIGPLTARHGSHRLLFVGLLAVAFGLGAIPYVPAEQRWLAMLGALTFIGIGNALFQPSLFTLLNRLAGRAQLGIVMGAQESQRALSSILGTLLGGWVWSLTWNGTDFWSLHTVFRISGLFVFAAAVLLLLAGLALVPPASETVEVHADLDPGAEGAVA